MTEDPQEQGPTVTPCPCGQPLLLERPGRDQREACRLGRAVTPLPVHEPRPDPREHCTGCGAFTGCAEGRCLGCRVGVSGGGLTLPEPRQAVSVDLSPVSDPVLFDPAT